MYNVAIVLNNTNANISLSYQTKEGAQNALRQYQDATAGSILSFEDDFGHKVIVPLQYIAYSLFIDVEQDQICRFEQDLCKRRAELKLIERLNENPEERALFPAEPPAQQNRAPRIIQ